MKVVTFDEGRAGFVDGVCVALEVAFVLGALVFLWRPALGSRARGRRAWISALIPFAYQVVSLIGLWVFAQTKRFASYRAAQVALMLLLPFLLQWSLGGFVDSGYYLAIGTYRFGLDPDNQSVPIITSLMDLAGIAVVLFVMTSLGVLPHG